MIDYLLPVVFLISIVCILFLILLPFILYGRKKGKIRHANFLRAKSQYEEALTFLDQQHANSEAHIRTLQLGREYYAYLHPDLCDFGFDERPLRIPADPTQISFRNNATIIETKIQSDIQARIGKGKI